MNVGDRIRVTFPAEPAVRCAGMTVEARVAFVRDGEYPLRVEWEHEGATLSRFVQAAWCETVADRARRLSIEALEEGGFTRLEPGPPAKPIKEPAKKRRRP